ncbi:MAG TPA: hypothetical protein VIS31_03985 [Woeseiaceae bacterium]
MLLAAWLLLGLLAGCVGPDRPGPAAMSRHTLLHDGLEREYFVFLPSSYDGRSARPVVFFMHGYGGSATGTEAETTQGLNRYADAYGYVMVYPQSTWFMSDDASGERSEISSWNHISDAFDTGPAGPICTPDAERYPCPPECGNCGDCGWASCYDDVGFLKDLFERVARDLAVDPARFFVSGFSNGALMANRIGCEAAERIAAVALIGGRVEPGFECTPSRPLPLLQVNGSADTAVPFDGRASDDGYFFASTDAIVEHWTDRAECATARDAWQSQVIPAGAAECTVACAGSAQESVDCLWLGGDHRWPGTPGLFGSNGYCVSELQARSMPEQTICLKPDPATEIWGSRLLFEFFSSRGGHASDE